MIASIPIAVLPVLLSPTINIRCPDPIQVKESTARIPVSIGVRILSRVVIPGAFFSINEYSTSFLFQFNPSSELPSGSNTLPRDKYEATTLMIS